MTHSLAYVKHEEGSDYWQLYCTCLNEGQPGRDQDPIFSTGWIGGIVAHESDVPCASKHEGSYVWTVRRIDASHVEFAPSINAEGSGHFHTTSPTPPIEVRA